MDVDLFAYGGPYCKLQIMFDMLARKPGVYDTVVDIFPLNHIWEVVTWWWFV